MKLSFGLFLLAALGNPAEAAGAGASVTPVLPSGTPGKIYNNKTGHCWRFDATDINDGMGTHQWATCNDTAPDQQYYYDASTKQLKSVGNANCIICDSNNLVTTTNTCASAPEFQWHLDPVGHLINGRWPTRCVYEQTTPDHHLVFDGDCSTDEIFSLQPAPTLAPGPGILYNNGTDHCWTYSHQMKDSMNAFLWTTCDDSAPEQQFTYDVFSGHLKSTQSPHCIIGDSNNWVTVTDSCGSGAEFHWWLDYDGHMRNGRFPDKCVIEAVDQGVNYLRFGDCTTLGNFSLVPSATGKCDDAPTMGMYCDYIPKYLCQVLERARTTCPRTCGVCTPPPVVDNCRDETMNGYSCDWMQHYYGYTKQEFCANGMMKGACRKYCGLCTPGAAASKAISAPPSPSQTAPPSPSPTDKDPCFDDTQPGYPCTWLQNNFYGGSYEDLCKDKLMQQQVCRRHCGVCTPRTAAPQAVPADTPQNGPLPPQAIPPPPPASPNTTSVALNITSATKGTGTGDPHFTTFGGKKYDFHGGCDLVFLNIPDFQDGKGLRIHIRTNITSWWSSIEAAVLEIGSERLELQGKTGGGGTYWLNGVEHDLDELQHKAAFHFAGFKLTYSKRSQHHGFRLDLGRAMGAIGFEAYKEFLTVNVNARDATMFEGSVGLLGSYPEGIMLARDGMTDMKDDHVAFGKEWQVLPSEPMLFHEVKGVQSPQECAMPDTITGRRLRGSATGDGMLSQEEAEDACENAPEEDKTACIFDVLATNDVGMAGAY